MSPNNDEILPIVYQQARPVLKTRNGREIKYIRHDEVHLLLSCVAGRDALLIEVLWNTGARVSEALCIALQDVNFEDSTLSLKTLKKRKRLNNTGKKINNEIRGLELAIKHDPNSKLLRKKLQQAQDRLSQLPKQAPPVTWRTVPITREIVGKLAAYAMQNDLKPSDRLFPISRVRVFQILQEAGERAGIDKDRRHPHVFRHGFAVNAVLTGVPPLVLRNWMGHSDIQSTLMYTECLAKDSRHYFDKMRF